MFSPEDKNIRFGLTAIKNVGENIVHAIIENRISGGPFPNLTSFLSRVNHKDLNKKSLEALIKCGALDSLGTERNLALSSIEDIVKFASAAKKEQKNGQTGLFGVNATPQSLRLKAAPPATAQEKLTWEKELLGLYVTDHPLNSFKAKIETIKAKPISAVLLNPSESQYHRIAGVISKIQKIVTKTGKPMIFATIQDFDNSLEVVVFPDTLIKNAAMWRENNPIVVVGRMSSKNGETKMICENAAELVQTA